MLLAEENRNQRRGCMCVVHVCYSPCTWRLVWRRRKWKHIAPAPQRLVQQSRQKKGL